MNYRSRVPCCLGATNQVFGGFRMFSWESRPFEVKGHSGQRLCRKVATFHSLQVKKIDVKVGVAGSAVHVFFSFFVF